DPPSCALGPGPPGGRAAAAQRPPRPLGERRGLPAPPAGHRRHRGHRGLAARGVPVDAARFAAVLRAHARGGRHLGRGRAGVGAAAPGADVRPGGAAAAAGGHAGALRGRRVQRLLRRGAGRPADPRAGAGDRLGAALRRPGDDAAGAHHHAGQRRRGGGVLPRLGLRGSGCRPAGARLDRRLRAGHDDHPQSRARAGQRAHGPAVRSAAQYHRRHPGLDAHARGVVGADAALPPAAVHPRSGRGAGDGCRV
ncbi:MAG: Integral membrane protein, partial [uncultured Friedmanniella sp.]